MEALAHLVRYHRDGDQLRMRMLQARARRAAVVLEDDDLLDAWVLADLVVADLVSAQDVGDVSFRQQGRGEVMLAALDDHIVDADAVHRPPRAFDLAGR